MKFKSPPFNKEKSNLRNFKIPTMRIFDPSGKELKLVHITPSYCMVCEFIQITDEWNKWSDMEKGVFISFSSKDYPWSEHRFLRTSLFSPFRLCPFTLLSLLVCLHLFCLLSPLHLFHSFPPTLSQPFPSRFLSGWHASVWSWNALFLSSKWQKSHQYLEQQCSQCGIWTNGGIRVI